MSDPLPTDDRDVLTPSTAVCVCGHVKAHHPLHLGAFHAPCTWRGCGCPAFVKQRDDG